MKQQQRKFKTLHQRKFKKYHILKYKSTTTVKKKKIAKETGNTENRSNTCWQKSYMEIK